MTTFDSDANINNAQSVPEEELFTNLVKPYLFTHYDDSKWYPALEFKQGGRTMLQINVRASFVPTLLKPNPSDADKNDPYSGKNRPVRKEHAAKIKQYVIDRAKTGNNWILGTLTANLADDPKNPRIIEIKRLGFKESAKQLSLRLEPENQVPESEANHTRVTLAQLYDAGITKRGMPIRVRLKRDRARKLGRSYVNSMEISATGTIIFQGQEFDIPSPLATEVNGSAAGGWDYIEIKIDGQWVRLEQLRQIFRQTSAG